jgi:hypothetical protein
MIRFNSAKYKDQPPGKGFSVKVEAVLWGKYNERNSQKGLHCYPERVSLLPGKGLSVKVEAVLYGKYMKQIKLQEMVFVSKWKMAVVDNRK